MVRTGCVIAVVTALVVESAPMALAADPSPLPSASAGASHVRASDPAPSLTETFVSPLHGYSVRYAPDWTVTSAREPWTRGARLLWGDPALDELHSGTVRFTGASQPLPEGQSPEKWIAAYAGPGADPSTWSPTPIGDQVGLIDVDGVPALAGTIVPGGLLFDAVVVIDGRGYNFTMDGQLDHAALAAMLATVALDPDSAHDAAAAP